MRPKSLIRTKVGQLQQGLGSSLAALALASVSCASAAVYEFMLPGKPGAGHSLHWPR